MFKVFLYIEKKLKEIIEYIEQSKEDPEIKLKKVKLKIQRFIKDMKSD